MDTEDADDLVLFLDAKVISSTAQALLCQIGEKNVWLPRWHISGKLWRAGDRGKLFIRRWVARDRKLIGAPAAALQLSVATVSRLPAVLHSVR